MKPLSKAIVAASLLAFIGNSCLAQSTAEQQLTTKLEGQITTGSKEAVDCKQLVDLSSTQLFDVLNKNQTPAITKSGITKKTASRIVSLGNFMFDLRGFDWSVEGADVALGEKLNYKSEISREYATRRLHDQRELETVCTIFQKAMVNGLSDSTRKDHLLTACDSKLGKLLGDGAVDELNHKFEQVTLRNAGSNVIQSSQSATWTVEEQQENLKLIVDKSIEKDPRIKDLMTRLHKFNGRSKFARVTAKLVYTTLGLAAFAPTFVAPAAEASLLAFMTATGGPEQDKLLREMYLNKCLESRYKTIYEEAHVAVANAQVAALSGNKPLEACSLALVEQIAGSETTAQIFPDLVSEKRVASKAVKEVAAPAQPDSSHEASADTLD